MENTYISEGIDMFLVFKTVIQESKFGENVDLILPFLLTIFDSFQRFIF